MLAVAAVHAAGVPAVASSSADVVKVGVIGGGLGGSSAAYFLRDAWKDPNRTLDITFVTDNTTGRTRSVGVGGQMFEEGGSVIHPKNLYMKAFVERVAHTSELTGGEGNGFTGIIEKEGFFFFTTDHPLEDKLRLAMRYGLSILRIEEIVDKMLKRFESIYGLQDSGKAFKTVADMLNAMDPSGDFLNMTRMSGRDYMKAHHISDEAIRELVSVATRINYNQDPDEMTAFPTLVSLAGSQDGLFSVKGGNCRVAEGLRNMSGAGSPTGSFVTSIQRIANGAAGSKPVYNVTTRDLATNALSSTIFDALVLATPLQDSGITLIDFPRAAPLPACCIEYRTVYVTFVKGMPRPEFAHLPSSLNGTRYPDLVATLPSTDMLFTCIGRESTVSGEPVHGDPVWKLFSQVQLTDAHINEVFEKVDHVYHGESGEVSHKWLAYPQYGAGPEEFLPFLLDDALAYTSTIEWVASAMEMSVISGRNAALLLHNALHG
ncbi:prenylcysteine oxidase 1-like [Sycon ciliatum]|uniref:prenylcysteine oxidase 1-like n=1 Tax=Sycon ciliatum TaxID=27933 RepID=UPI0031F713FF